MQWAKRENIAVVVVNSRLGALGYLYDGAGTGNMGLYDNILALGWIQQNIEMFGGDPSRVGLACMCDCACLCACVRVPAGREHRCLLV